jgi:hypothetical protein
VCLSTPLDYYETHCICKQNVLVLAKNGKKKPKITLRDPGVQEAGMQNNCSGFKQQQESPMPESRHKKRAARKQPVHYPNNF